MRQALVVDDHPIVRDAVRELLQNEFPSIVMKDSAGGEGIVHEICGSEWAFVVLDINFPKQNGIDVLKKVIARCPNIPIVMFSLFTDEQYAARALRAGAMAYISKDRSPQDLVEAVRGVLRGAPVRKVRKELRPILSDREVEVLTHFAKGMSRRDISKRLSISEKTVSTYKARLFHKLGLSTTVELIRYANDEGLIE
ncbi:putative Fimbriae Z protein [Nitrospira sp. KM1]|uniref:response regulator n=1 Tax=Nitrospira sp. KM1 TaxID=1936990 RepID=UPI0013A732E3|nr:response regulator transcription factor [Nitrospira sp. KM1]BCA54893.1 putative Fimbriae Z protein [Nitrospira sp. KM1]